MKLAYILIVWSAIWMSVTLAHDQVCDGKEDGVSCYCGSRYSGQCESGFCMCDPVRRKRAACSGNSECSWCSGYCSGGSCVCPA